MIKLNDLVTKCSLDGEIVLLDGRRGSYFGLNEVGSRMLELAMQSEDRESAITTLLSEFDADESEIRKDFDELLKKLLSKKLIVDHEA